MHVLNINVITAVLESASKETIRALFDDDATIFWVDWREDEADIVRYCETVLRTGSLTAEWVRAAITIWSSSVGGSGLHWSYK